MLKIVGRTLFVALWLIFAAFCIILILIPLAVTVVVKLGYHPTDVFGSWLPPFERTRLAAMQLFLPLWVFFVGGCFGSFLNVVAWRVPRGQSILGSSHCPSCNVLLKFPTTNVPILGWLKNGGRCGSCQWRIPVRYFIAELSLGIAFAVLYLTQASSGGVAIPFRELIELDQDDRTLKFDLLRLDLLTIFGYHLSLLSLVFTFAICGSEKFRAPIRILLVGIAILFGFQAFDLSPGIVDFHFGSASEEHSASRFLMLLKSPQNFLLASGCGIIAASGCFLAFRLASQRDLHGSYASLLLVGIALGWQAVLSVSVISCLIRVVTKLHFTAAIFCATVVHLCTWRLQLDWWCWPGPKSGPLQLACGVILVCVLTAIIRFTTTGSLPLDTDGSQKK